MGTRLEEIYDMFLVKINDPDLAELPLEDIKYHLRLYLDSAISEHLAPIPESLTKYDDEGFEEELSMQLKSLVANGMVLSWLEPKIHEITILRSAVSGRDYSENSNANQLNSLMNLKTRIKQKIDDIYASYDYTREDFKGFR